jgi:hypothetical protein
VLCLQLPVNTRAYHDCFFKALRGALRKLARCSGFPMSSTSSLGQRWPDLHIYGKCKSVFAGTSYPLQHKTKVTPSKLGAAAATTCLLTLRCAGTKPGPEVLVQTAMKTF